MTRLPRFARVARCFILSLAMGVLGISVWAQTPQAYSQAELDQMLAPVALYPDTLLSQLLMAATYPLEVVEAQRWALANPSARGNTAVQAVDQNNWDPSVKSMVAFPKILQTMSTNLDWTKRLGDAFLGQQQQVMDTVQNLRKKAYAAGNLVSGAQDRVSMVGDQITIQPNSPLIVYEPYYDPAAVYGSWWWPQYPPEAWSPWPGYAYVDGFGSGFMWGAGVAVAADFWFGSFDWGGHHVNVNHDHFHDRRFPEQSTGTTAWQHNPAHRQGVAYRQPPPTAMLRAPIAATQNRQAFRGFQTAPSGSALPATRAATNPATRAGTPAQHAAAPAANVRQSMAAPAPHAFENIEQGHAVRDFSARGHASVQPRAPSSGRGACPPGGCGAQPGAPRSAPGAGGMARHR